MKERLKNEERVSRTNIEGGRSVEANRTSEHAWSRAKEYVRGSVKGTKMSLGEGEERM